MDNHLIVDESLKITYLISPYDCPYLNLALEDYLLRQCHCAENQVQILFYINRPSVILGNFQCLWKEIPIHELEAASKNILIARRQSGGGTVYHDKGNLNFCFIFNKSNYAKNHFNQFLVDFFRSSGLNVESSGRDDLCIKIENVFYKFSGQAFKNTLDKTLHHGTLLFDSDLTQLQRLCIPQKEKIKSKSIDSVVSKVTNLKSHLNTKSKEQEVSNTKDAFGLGQQIVERLRLLNRDVSKLQLSTESESIVESKALELKSWECIHGKGPKISFKLYHSNPLELIVTIEKGKIAEVDAKWSGEVDTELEIIVTKFKCLILSSRVASKDWQVALGALEPREHQAISKFLLNISTELASIMSPIDRNKT